MGPIFFKSVQKGSVRTLKPVRFLLEKLLVFYFLKKHKFKTLVESSVGLGD